MIQTQVITLELDGITADDYIAHFVDADPAFEATGLGSVTIDADPFGSEVVAVLRWRGAPPPVETAARAAGLNLTGDVVAVHSRPVALAVAA